MDTDTVWGENGEFCVTVAFVTRTAGILTLLFKTLAARSRLSDNVGHASLIGSNNPRRLNGQ